MEEISAYHFERVVYHKKWPDSIWDIYVNDAGYLECSALYLKDSHAAYRRRFGFLIQFAMTGCG